MDLWHLLLFVAGNIWKVVYVAFKKLNSFHQSTMIIKLGVETFLLYSMYISFERIKQF